MRFPYVHLSPWKVYVAGFIFPTFGLLAGFLLAKLFRQSNTYARTIALETGIQNIPLTLTVITLSFPFRDLPKIFPQVLITSIFILIETIISITCYRLVKKIGKSKNNIREEGETYKSDTEKCVEVSLMVDAQHE